MAFWKGAWDTLTGGKGLYEYVAKSDLLVMLTNLTKGLLWRTAVKATLFKVQIHGVEGNDAEQIKALFLANNPSDFKEQQKTKWPQWMETTFQTMAHHLGQAPGEAPTGPRFLDPMLIVDFLQALVYEDGAKCHADEQDTS